MFYQKITFYNWGVYYKRKEFNFNIDPSSNRVIIPIGGRSGEGKTTLLNGVKTAWFGQNADCANRRSYRHFIRSMLNNISKVEGDSKCFIEMVLLKRDHRNNLQSILIRREWDLSENGEFNERLTIKLDDKIPQELEDNQDKNLFLQQLMPVEISQFFLFDGENVQTIANDETFDKHIDKAVMDTLNISNYANLIDSLGNYIKKEKTKLNNDVARSNISSLSSDVFRLNEENAKLDVNLSLKKRELNAINEELTRINSWMRGNGITSPDQRDSLIRELEDKHAQKENLRDQIIHHMKGSLSDYILKPKLQEIQVQIELEEQYLNEKQQNQRTEELFEEILNQLDSPKIKPLLKESQKITIKHLQRGIWKEKMNQPINEIPLIHSNAISQVEMDDFKDYINLAISNAKKGNIFTEEFNRNYKQVLADIETLQQLITNLPSETDIRTTKFNLKELNDAHVKLSVEIQQMTSRVEVIEQERNRLKIKRVQMMKELNIKNSIDKKIKEALLYQEVLEEFVKVLKKRKSEDVSKHLTSMFTKLLRKKDYARNFNFDPITLRVTFENDLQQKVQKNNLSQSEKQIYAVSLLWALQMASKHRFPVIIDTPLGRLDAEHKANMIEHYFPYAGPQVIILSTDEEISIARKGMLAPYIANEFRLEISPENHHEVHVVEGYFEN